MKRALTLPYHSIFRAIATTTITPIINSPNYRLLQSSFYSTITTSSNRSFQCYSFFINGGSSRIASVAAVGALTSVAATVALCEKAQAKEQPPSEFLPNEVVLYQYEACPFCNKVKALLDYYDIPYKIVEVNPLNKKEIQWSDYKKVPILMVDGEKLVDSSDIIDKFCSRILPERTNEQRISDPEAEETEETKWRKWVDNHLVHLLSPNIYRNTAEALESFDYITSNGNFSFTEKITVKYAGAIAMYFVSKKLKKKYNITDERAALYESAEAWVNALDGRKFMGGSKPNLADLAVFGVLRPIRYLRSGKDMIENTRIGEWFSRMEREVGESSRINTQVRVELPSQKML